MRNFAAGLEVEVEVEVDGDGDGDGDGVEGGGLTENEEWGAWWTDQMTSRTSLAELGRIEVELDDPDVVRVLSAVHVWPLG